LSKTITLEEKMPSNRLYNTIFKWINQQWPGWRVTQKRNLAWLLVGIYLAKSVLLSKIALEIPGQAVEVSVIKRLSRFLGNPVLQVRTCYDPLVQPLLQSIAQFGCVRLIVDGTKVGPYHKLLMVSVAYRRRAIPVAWTWVPHVRGHRVTRISNGGTVSGSRRFAPVDVVYFEVMVAFTHDSGAGTAILNACGSSAAWNLYVGPGGGLPGFVSMSISVPSGCTSWSLSASGGYVDFRSVDANYVSPPPPVSTNTFTPIPTGTFTPSLTATETPVPAITFTPTLTATDTLTPTATETLAAGVTPSETPTPSDTPSPTATNTPSPTLLPGVTPSNTPVPPVWTNTPKPPPSSSGGQGGSGGFVLPTATFTQTMVSRPAHTSTAASALGFVSATPNLVETARVMIFGTATPTPTPKPVSRAGKSGSGFPWWLLLAGGAAAYAATKRKQIAQGLSDYRMKIRARKQAELEAQWAREAAQKTGASAHGRPGRQNRAHGSGGGTPLAARCVHLPDPPSTWRSGNSATMPNPPAGSSSGPWDFKVEQRTIWKWKDMTESMELGGLRVRRDTLANIHYGYVGRSLGYSRWFLEIGAGMAQIKAGTWKWEYWLTWFDDPVDNAAIRAGMDLYDGYTAQGQEINVQALQEVLQSHPEVLCTPKCVDK
jgi:hypothetical protein